MNYIVGWSWTWASPFISCSLMLSKGPGYPLIFGHKSHACPFPTSSSLEMAAPSSSTLVTGPLPVFLARITASVIAHLRLAVVSSALAGVSMAITGHGLDDIQGSLSLLGCHCCSEQPTSSYSRVSRLPKSTF